MWRRMRWRPHTLPTRSFRWCTQQAWGGEQSRQMMNDGWLRDQNGVMPPAGWTAHRPSSIALHAVACAKPAAADQATPAPAHLHRHPPTHCTSSISLLGTSALGGGALSQRWQQVLCMLDPTTRTLPQIAAAAARTNVTTAHRRLHIPTLTCRLTSWHGFRLY